MNVSLGAHSTAGATVTVAAATAATKAAAAAEVAVAGYLIQRCMHEAFICRRGVEDLMCMRHGTSREVMRLYLQPSL